MRMIWDQAPHNGFPTLHRFNDSWFCVFREGSQHGYDRDAATRVLESADGENWTSAALLRSPYVENPDKPNPNPPETTNDKLMLLTAVAGPYNNEDQMVVWFSPDGRQWSKPYKIGELKRWIYDVVEHKGVFYGVGYYTRGWSTGLFFTDLYYSHDGVNFHVLVDTLFDVGTPTEGALVFLENDRAICVLRRDKVGTSNASAQLGMADPPYTEWSWADLGMRLEGPDLLRLPDGRIVAGGRVYIEGLGTRTSLLWLDHEEGKLTEFLRLPSGGDSGYPGLVFHDGLIWVAYYSSHEEKSKIYIARVDPDLL